MCISGLSTLARPTRHGIATPSNTLPTRSGHGNGSGPNVALGAALAGNVVLDNASASVGGTVTQSQSLVLETDVSGDSGSSALAGAKGSGGAVANTLITT